MLRSALTLAGLVAFGSAAQAQQALTLHTSRKIAIAGPIRDAGIYHQASNTWTRQSAQADIGADIIYSNTLPGGYFYWLSGDTFIDEGRIPSTTSPTQSLGINLSRPGCANSYTVDGVAFTYCTQDITGGNFTLTFFQSYTPCATVIGVTPQGTVAINGPSTVANGTTYCWNVTVDLAPANGFVLLADGDGSFNGTVTGGGTGAPGAGDRFGWSISSSLVSTFAEGPTLAGFWGYNCPDSTVWDSPVNYLEEGTGMSTTDHFRVESGPSTPGCYFFNCCSIQSFALELFADACPCTPPGVVFCCGDGTGAACPCGNNSLVSSGSCAGCKNSLNLGAQLSGNTLGCPDPGIAVGGPFISNDTVRLVGTNMPDSSALYFQGTLQAGTPAGAGTTFGDGKRCATGTLIRLGTKTNVLGTSSYPTVGDPSISVRGGVSSPGTRTYQVWYRNAAAFCTVSPFNLSNGYQITWSS